MLFGKVGTNEEMKSLLLTDLGYNFFHEIEFLNSLSYAHNHRKMKLQSVMTSCIFISLVFVALMSSQSCKAFNTPTALWLRDGSYPIGSEIGKNREVLLDKLANISARKMYGNAQVGVGNATLYGQFECRGDVDTQLCRNCTRLIAFKIRQFCQNSLSVTLWIEWCFLRYENYPFFGIRDTSLQYMDNSDMYNFDGSLGNAIYNLLGNLSAKVEMDRSPPSYASDSVVYGPQTVYGIAQCWHGLSPADCRVCLNTIISFWHGLSPADCRVCLNTIISFVQTNLSMYGGRVCARSCMVRYELNSFTESPPPIVHKANKTQPLFHKTSPTSSKKGSKILVLLGVLGGCLVLMLVGICIFIIINKRRKSVKLHLKDDPFSNGDKHLIFTMEELRVATNDFNERLKLGEGGFGIVYKGYLRDGKEVAIKKLSFKSNQGEQEFMAEINLLANMQHKNLVSLLGCCKEEGLLILVYEYLPNKSLDSFLFDANENTGLNWWQRYNIILGIARGLMYLHEESKLKIVHRDIKASNILLDEKFNPKIADFGLARLFQEDETQVQTTEVAGTRGYMAPEYVLHGIVSAKSDVYSYGVLLLEMIGGRKNIDMSLEEGKQNLVEWTWRLHQQRSVLEMVDENIKDACDSGQVARTVHLALLCTDGEPSLRPFMSDIVFMLSSHVDTTNWPSPSNPNPPHIFDKTQSSSSSSSNNHPFRRTSSSTY